MLNKLSTAHILSWNNFFGVSVKRNTFFIIQLFLLQNDTTTHMYNKNKVDITLTRNTMHMWLKLTAGAISLWTEILTEKNSTILIKQIKLHWVKSPSWLIFPKLLFMKSQMIIMMHTHLRKYLIIYSTSL